MCRTMQTQDAEANETSAITKAAALHAEQDRADLRDIIARHGLGLVLANAYDMANGLYPNATRDTLASLREHLALALVREEQARFEHEAIATN